MASSKASELSMVVLLLLSWKQKRNGKTRNTNRWVENFRALDSNIFMTINVKEPSCLLQEDLCWTLSKPKGFKEDLEVQEIKEEKWPCGTSVQWVISLYVFYYELPVNTVSTLTVSLPSFLSHLQPRSFCLTLWSITCIWREPPSASSFSARRLVSYVTNNVQGERP